MQYMPLFVDMHQRRVLIIGGGDVALRKARQFAEAGSQIKVIAPAIKTEFSELPNIISEARKAVPDDITDNYFAVIIATDDKTTNDTLSKICKKKSIIVDRCDSHTESDFITGSITTSGSVINATVSGGIPSLSRFINLEVKKIFTPELQELSELLLELRPLILASKKTDKSFLKNIVKKETLERIKAEGVTRLKQEIISCL